MDESKMAALDALESANARERELRKERETPATNSGARWIVGVTVGIAFVFSIVLALAIGKGIHASGIRYGLGIALIIVYLGAFYYPASELWLRRRAVAGAIQRPDSVLFRNARLTCEADEGSIETLFSLPLRDLEFVSMELRNERDAFARRSGLLIGAIETLGVFPALLAFAITISQLGEKISAWVWIVAYAIPGLYVLGTWGQFEGMRLERNCRLLDLVISWKRTSFGVDDPGKEM